MVKYKRYIIMGLHDGRLVRIIARRAHEPDDIIRRVLDRVHPYDRLYILEVGDEGVYGQCTNLKLQEIVSPPPPPPTPKYVLKDVEAIF